MDNKYGSDISCRRDLNMWAIISTVELFLEYLTFFAADRRILFYNPAFQRLPSATEG